jgi:hypothetical protein
MANPIKKLWDWTGSATTAWGILPSTWQAGATGALSAVTGWLGYKEAGLAQAIFLAAGVFAFGMAAIFFALRVAAITGLFQRLSIPGVGVHTAAMGKGQSIAVLSLNCVLRNDSQRLMFYRLKRATSSVARQVGSNNSVDKNIIIIPPNGGTQTVFFSSIENIPYKNGGAAPSGSIELDVEYGPSADDLKYVFSYGADVQIGIAKNKAKNETQLTVVSSVTTYIHSRA